MPSEHFSGYTLTKVSNLIKKGTDKVVVYRDKEVSGLAIKVTATGASWYLSTRDLNRQIADFISFGKDDIPTLRKLIDELKREHAKGRDVAPMIAAFSAGHTVQDAKHLHDVEHGDALTWETARDMYLEWAADNKEKDTVRGYRSALGATPGLAADFEPILGKPLPSITTADLATVRNNIIARIRAERGKGHGIRQADHTVAAMKAAFKYFVNTPTTGVKSNPAADLSKSLEKSVVSSKEGQRALSQFELGALWHALLGCRNEQVRLILQLQLLSGQRRFTPTAALKKSFQVDGPYACVWGMEDKTHHWRKLALPPVATKVVEQAMRLTRDDCDYLFPKQRPRRKGDDMNGHINERTVSEKIEDMRKPGGVFEKMPFNVSTHDMRKTFTSVIGPKMSMFELEGRKLSPKEVVMITHLNEGRDSVSEKVYDRNVNLDVKLEILTLWERYVMDGYAMYLASLEMKKAA